MDWLYSMRRKTIATSTHLFMQLFLTSVMYFNHYAAVSLFITLSLSVEYNFNDVIVITQSDMMNLSMLDFVHVDDREIFMRQMRVNQKDQPASPPEDGQPSVPEYVKMGMTSEEFKGIINAKSLYRLSVG